MNVLQGMRQVPDGRLQVEQTRAGLIGEAKAWQTSNTTRSAYGTSRANQR